MLVVDDVIDPVLERPERLVEAPRHRPRRPLHVKAETGVADLERQGVRELVPLRHAAIMLISTYLSSRQSPARSAHVPYTSNQRGTSFM